MVDLTTQLGAIKLDNPIIVSSGYVTDTENAIRKADSFGPGAIVIKSSLMEDEYSRMIPPFAFRQYPTNRYRYGPAADGLIMGDNMSAFPLEVWAEWLNKNKDRIATPLIGSVAAISLEGYVRGAKLFEDAGAVGVELLLACPAPYFRPFKYSMTSDAKVVEEVCRAVRRAVKIPVGAKVFPLPSAISRAAYGTGIDWVTVGGVIMAYPGVNLDTLEPSIPFSFSVTGSHAYKYQTFRALYGIRDISSKAHISAHGGVHDWQDIIEMILYGASSVQAQTIFMKKGFKVIPGMKRGLAEYMEKKGFATLNDVKGRVLPKLVAQEKMAAYLSEMCPKTKGLVIARVDEKLCNGCELCQDVCAWDAIKVIDGLGVVDRGLCEGCSLCALDCPTHAITMKNLELLREIVARV